MKKLITLLFVCLLQTSFATTYYVSNSGSDANTGTTISTPWQSINKISTTDFNPGDKILFKRGDVFYGGITVNQSGTLGNPITFGSYGTGAMPIITGLTDITSWTNISGNIWESTSSVSSLPYTKLVLVNGNNTAMGRTPNTGSYYTFQSFNSNTTINSTDVNSSVTDWTGAEIAINITTYNIGRNPITSHIGNQIIFTPQAMDGNVIQRANQNFIIQNDTRTLDQQNEWYYNPSTKKLRIYSAGTPANVQISSVENLISLSNKNYITIEGIEFQGSNKTSIFLSRVSNINVTNCNFNYAGIDGIVGVYAASSNNVVVDGCNFSSINNTAIDLSTDFTNVTISNNNVNGAGMVYGMGGAGTNNGNGNETYGGIYASGANTLIEQNSIKNVGYKGIHFFGDYSVIQKNFIENFCAVLSDGGGIYTVDGSNPTRVKYGMKILDNIVINSPKGYGIYLDDWSNGVEVLRNSIYNCEIGFMFHNTFNIKVEHNKIMNASLAGLDNFIDDNTARTRTSTFKNNTIITFNNTGYDNRVYYLEKYEQVSDQTDFDSNYLARVGYDTLYIDGKFMNGTYARRSLSQWQSVYGQDIHSKRLPVKIASSNNLSFEYNATDIPTTISLDGRYIDVKENVYNGTITLQPWRSAILIKDGEATTGLTENATSISIFPNPMNDHFTVESATQISSIKVIDLSGRTMKTFKPTSSNVYSISGLASGTYLVVITDGNSEVSKQIVKQ